MAQTPAFVHYLFSAVQCEPEIGFTPEAGLNHAAGSGASATPVGAVATGVGAGRLSSSANDPMSTSAALNAAVDRGILP
jgi:hypothetical protein